MSKSFFLSSCIELSSSPMVSVSLTPGLREICGKILPFYLDPVAGVCFKLFSSCILNGILLVLGI